MKPKTSDNELRNRIGFLRSRLTTEFPLNFQEYADNADNHDAIYDLRPTRRTHARQLTLCD